MGRRAPQVIRLWLFGATLALIAGVVVFRFFSDVPQHGSYFSDRAFFDRAYDSVAPVAATTRALGGILPHHLLAAPYFANFYERLEARPPSTVVLLGPNHLQRGEHFLLASEARWATPYGMVRPNAALINTLVRDTAVHIDERVFAIEHSISSHVAFIKKSFPRATVVPIVVKSGTSAALLDDLSSTLCEASPNDALVLASVDFVHDTSAAEADRLDVVSEPILLAADASRLDDVTADSPESLAVLFGMLRCRNASQGTLLDHGNAATVTREPLPAVTSYFGIAYDAP